MVLSAAEIPVRRVAANGIDINVAVAGTGPAVLLLHGFPHTWRLWSDVIGALAPSHRVIAPDLRGLGASARPDDGYDAETLAADAAGLLDALGERNAAVVGIDLGTPPAFLLAMRRPERVRRLVVMESLLGRLPGAEDFLRDGPPWWFGFHAVPGLAERVLSDHESAYVDWFLTAGTRGRGVPPELRDAFVEAYTGPDALRAAFAHYRAMPESARRIERAVAETRLRVPTLAIGAHPVGNALARQLAPHTDDLTGRVIPRCGHIIPIDGAADLHPLLADFLAP
ncbi:alpha/beta fold hydrolase [Nocardia sp. BMG51109]|uniref:alpha/beta fold hydrolase n=1 Tax=Nocardia sp. BMG51109 TaxID=1056816 RepID=UPI00055D4108|nr:alpha/beta fold hydrolase [Nocardia sp. BMG51109]